MSPTTTAWPAPPASLAPVLVTPEHGRYPMLRSSYMAAGSPLQVIMARDEEDAAAAVVHAAHVRSETGHDVPFSIRSGGHGIAGSSTNAGGIVLDLSGLDRIDSLAADSSFLRVGAGAIWGDVAAHLAPSGRALTSGNFGDTGVGGLATSGGVGFFARSQGLTLDHVRRVRLLTADGAVRWVGPEEHPDLFWAIRGGGAQVGIALTLDLAAPRISDGEALVIHQQLQYLVEDLPGFVASWGSWIREAPRAAESFLMLQPRGDGRTVVEARTVWAGDDVAAATPTLQDAEQIAPVLHADAAILPYSAIVPTPRSPHLGQQRIRMRNVLAEAADHRLGEAMRESLAHPATALGELRALGGAVADVPVEDTAWAGRHQEVLAATWIRPAAPDAEESSFAPLQALGTGTYGAYSSDLSARAADLAWPGRTGARLRDLMADADPSGLFDRGLTLRRTPPAVVLP